MTEAKRRVISGISALAFLGTTYLPNLINGDLSWFSTSAAVDTSEGATAKPSILFSEENNGVDCTVENTNFTADATFGFHLEGARVTAKDGKDANSKWEGVKSLSSSDYVWESSPTLSGTTTYLYPYWSTNKIGDTQCINVSTKQSTGTAVHCFENVESITYTDAVTGEKVSIKENAQENDFISYCADNNHDMSPNNSQKDFKLWDITSVAADVADMEVAGTSFAEANLQNHDEMLEVCSRGYHAILANSYPLVSYDIDGVSFSDTEKRYVTQVALRLWRIYIMGWGRNADFANDTTHIDLSTYMDNRGETEAIIKMRYDNMLSTLSVVPVTGKCDQNKANAALKYLKLLMEEATKCELGAVATSNGKELNNTLIGWDGSSPAGVQSDDSKGVLSGVEYYNEKYSVTHTSNGELVEDGSSVSDEAVLTFASEGHTNSDGNEVYDVVTLNDGTSYLALGQITPSTLNFNNVTLNKKFTLNGLQLDENGEIVWKDEIRHMAEIDDTVFFTTTNLVDGDSRASLSQNQDINNTNLTTPFYVYKKLEGDSIPLEWRVKIGVANGQVGTNYAAIPEALSSTYQLAFLENTSDKAWDRDTAMYNSSQDLIAFIKNVNSKNKTLKVSVSDLEFSGQTDISSLTLDKRFFYGDEYDAGHDISSSLEELRPEIECILKNSDGKYLKANLTIKEDGSYQYSWTGWSGDIAGATSISFPEDSSLKTTITPLPSGSYEVYEKNGYQYDDALSEDNPLLYNAYSFVGFKTVGPEGEKLSSSTATVTVGKDQSTAIELYNKVNFDKLKFEKTFVLDSSQTTEDFKKLANETRFVVMRQSGNDWVEQKIVEDSIKDANGNETAVTTLIDNESGTSGEFTLGEGTVDDSTEGKLTYGFSWNYVTPGTYRFYEVSMPDELAKTFKLQGTNSGYDKEKDMYYVEVTTDDNPSVASVGSAVNTAQKLTLMVNKKWMVNGNEAELSDTTTKEAYQEAYEEFKENTYFCLAISSGNNPQQYLTLDDVVVNDESKDAKVGDSKGANTVKMANVDSSLSNVKIYTLSELCDGTVITLNPNATYNGVRLSDLDDFNIDLYEYTSNSLTIEKDVPVSASATTKVTYNFTINQSGVDDGITDNDTLNVVSNGFGHEFKQVGRVTGSFKEDSGSLQLNATNSLTTGGTVIVKKTGQLLAGSGESPAVVGAGFTLFKADDVDGLVDMANWTDESYTIISNAIAAGTLKPVSGTSEMIAQPTDGDGDGTTNSDGDFSLCSWNDIPEGVYYVVETTVPDGYKASVPSMVVSKGAESQSVSMVNGIDTAHLSIVKFEGDSSPSQLTKEAVDNTDSSIARIAGVNFALISRDTIEKHGWTDTNSFNNTWNYAAILSALENGTLTEDEYQTRKTDSRGIATFNNLRRGTTYVAVELSSDGNHKVSDNIADRFVTNLTPGKYTDIWGVTVDSEMMAAYYNAETTYEMSLSKYVEDSIQGVVNGGDDESGTQWNLPLAASFGWETTDWTPEQSALGDSFYIPGQYKVVDGRVQYSYEKTQTHYVEAPKDSVKFKLARLVAGSSTAESISQRLDLTYDLNNLSEAEIKEVYGSSDDTWELYDSNTFTLGHCYEYKDGSWSDIGDANSEYTVEFVGIPAGIYLAFETYTDATVAGHLAESPVMLTAEKSGVEGTMTVDGEDTTIKEVSNKAIFNAGDSVSALLFKSYQKLDTYDGVSRLSPDEEETYTDSKGVTYFNVPGLGYAESKDGNGHASGDTFGLFKVVPNADSYSAQLVDTASVNFDIGLSQYCVGFKNFDKTHGGWYFIREISVNSGYEIDPYCYFFTVAEDSNAAEDRNTFLPSILGEDGHDTVSVGALSINKYNVSTKFRRVADGEELNFLKSTDRTSKEYNEAYPMVGVNDLLSYVTHDNDTNSWVYSNTWRESYGFEYAMEIKDYDEFRNGYLAGIKNIDSLNPVHSKTDASFILVNGNVYQVGLDTDTTLGEKQYGDYDFASFSAVTAPDGEYGVSNKVADTTTTTTSVTTTGKVTTTPTGTTTPTNDTTTPTGTTTPTNDTTTPTGTTTTPVTTTDKVTTTPTSDNTTTITTNTDESTIVTGSGHVESGTKPSGSGSGSLDTTTTVVTDESTVTGSGSGHVESGTKPSGDDSGTTTTAITDESTVTGSGSSHTESGTKPSGEGSGSTTTVTESGSGTGSGSGSTTTVTGSGSGSGTGSGSLDTTTGTNNTTTTTKVSGTFDTVTTVTTVITNNTLGDIVGQLPSIPKDSTTGGSGTVINIVDGQGNLVDSKGDIIEGTTGPKRDANGNIILYIDENGNVTDSNGTILNITTGSQVSGGALLVSEDKNGNLIDSEGNRIYDNEKPKTDANGNVIRYVDSQGNIVDSTGKVIEGTKAPERADNGNLKVRYDENGHLVDSNGTVLNSSLDVDFDDSGNLIVKVDKNGNLVNSKGEIIYINGDLDLTGSLVITKEDKNGMKLDNATFEIYDASGNLVTTLTTGNNTETGYGYVDSLDFGDYTWIETVAPKGYGGSEEDKTVTTGTFTIDSIGESIHITVENSKLTSDLSVKKVTKGEDGRSKALSGAQFELFDEEGNSLGVKVTGNDGLATWSDVTAGNYTIKEVTAPSGFTLREDPIEVDFAGTTDVTVSFADVDTDFGGGLVLRKYDFVTGEAVPGAEFVITDKDTGETWSGTTDADGNLYCEDTDGDNTVNGFDLTAGHSYSYQETTAPDGYKINTTIGEFSYSTEGVVIYCEMEDLRESEEVKIQKVSADTLKTLGGATIGVYTSDDKLILKGVTTPDGFLTITDVTYSFDGYTYNLGDNTFEMPAGDYYYKEIEAPKGFVLDDTKYDFTVEGDKSDISTFILKNTGGKGTIVINKTDLTGAVEVEGAVIGLYVKNGSEYELYKDYQGVTSLLDGKASVVFENIPEGVYYFHEEFAPDGFIRDTAYYEIIVNNGVITHGKITNEFTGNTTVSGGDGEQTGEVTTVSTDNGGNIVTVTDKDGNVVTDSKGSDTTTTKTTSGGNGGSSGGKSSNSGSSSSKSGSSPLTGDPTNLLKVGGAMLVAAITSFFCRRKKKDTIDTQETIDNEEL